MTIHTSHPFASEADPARRLRGRLGGQVSLWTAGEGASRAGLTVSSLLVANGEPAHVIALLDPDADLTAVLEDSGRAVVHLLTWRHRDLAEVFAHTAPAPGGPFAQAEFIDTPAGPRLASVATWADVRLVDAVDVGWSRQVTCVLDHIELSPEDDAAGPDGPLLHRRGRYARA